MVVALGLDVPSRNVADVTWDFGLEMWDRADLSVCLLPDKGQN
jgi:hypothetical protein